MASNKWVKMYRGLNEFVTNNGGTLGTEFKHAIVDVRMQLNSYTRELRKAVQQAYANAAVVKKDATALYDAYLLAVDNKANLPTIKVLRRQYTRAIRRARKLTTTAYTLAVVARDIDEITGARTR